MTHERDVDAALRPHVQAAPLAKLPALYREIEGDLGRAGQRALARVDRYYLLTCLMGRVDAGHPWLYERCREVEAAPDGHLDLWAREHYKDLADDTPMLTRTRGWTTHGDLRVGDEVYAPNGRAVKVLALSERYTDGRCLRITFSDGASIVAGDGHLWSVRQKVRRRAPDGRRTEWVANVIPSAGLMVGDDVGAAREPVAGAMRALPVSPYVLGCWLGDGDSATGRICGADDEIFQAIEGLFCDLSPSHCPQRAPFQSRTVYGLAGDLRALGVLDNKHIPRDYLESSVEQRMALLRGLMDTDGHCSTRGTATFVNTNERLIDDVYELATGLALRPRKRAYRGYWTVSFQAHADRCPFTLTRKAQRCIQASKHRNVRTVARIERIASVPTRCIQVDGGLYLAGRELIPTNNSTIITFAGSIQEILRDPEITIGIFSHTRPIATKFLRQIKEELEQNARLIDLFPDVLWEKPHKDAPRWSLETGIAVKRSTNPKEATVEAHGLVDGQPTGAHFALLIYDDVVTLASVSTPEQVKKTTEAHSLSDNLGARGADGMKRKWHIGTRYSFADTYADLLERKVLTPRIYPATDDGSRDGRPVLLTPEAWEQAKRDQVSAILAAQMLQNPAAGTQAMFQQSWLRFADIRPATLSVAILCDPASSRKRGADSTALYVVGMDAARNRYLLDGYHHRMSLSQRWAALSGLWKKWSSEPGVQSVRVGYERYGSMSDIEYFEERMQVSGVRFPIEELNWPAEGSNAKFDRIQRLEPHFRNGRVYLIGVYKSETSNQKRMVDDGQPWRVLKPVRRVDENQQAYSLNKRLLDEYMVYPYSTHDDGLDCLSRMEDIGLNPPVLIDARDLEPEAV